MYNRVLCRYSTERSEITQMQQDSRSRDRQLLLGLSEHEGKVLTTQMPLSFSNLFKFAQY
jgi:hypothetical protein